MACTLHIKSSSLKAFLGQETFNTYTEFFDTFLTNIKDKNGFPIELNDEGVLLSDFAEIDITQEGYVLKTYNDLGLNPFSSFEDIVGFAIRNWESSLDESYREKILKEYEENLGLYNEALKNDSLNEPLLMDLKNKLHTLSSYLHSVGIKPADVKDPFLDFEEVEELPIEQEEEPLYIYPVNRIYDNDFTLTNEVDITRSQLGVIDTPLYFRVEQDNESNIQTTEGIENYGMVIVPYVKERDQFKRVYIKKKSTLTNKGLTIPEITTDINQAVEMGSNRSKLFTFVFPNLNKDTYRSSGKSLTELIANKIAFYNSLKKQVEANGYSDFFPTMFIEESFPRGTRISATEFLSGRKDFVLSVAAEGKKVIRKGEPIIEIDGNVIPLSRVTSNLNTEWILGLVKYEGDQAKEVKDFLNKLFNSTKSIFVFGTRDNKVIVYTRKKWDGKKWVKIDTNLYQPSAKEIPIYISQLYLNVNRKLIGTSQTFYRMEEGLVSYEQDMNKFYLDTLTTRNRLIKTDKGPKLLTYKNLAFETGSPESGIFIKEEEYPSEMNAVEFIENQQITQTTFNALKALQSLLESRPDLKDKFRKLRIKFLDKEGFKGTYEGDTITVNPNLSDLTEVIVEKFIHALTSDFIQSNPNDPTVIRLKALGQQLLSEGKIDEYDSSPEEVIALVSKPKYFELVRETKGLLEEIVDAIRELLNKIFFGEVTLEQELISKILDISTRNVVPKDKSNLRKKRRLGADKESLRIANEEEKNKGQQFINKIVTSLDTEFAIYLRLNNLYFKFFDGSLNFNKTWEAFLENLEEVREIDLEDQGADFNSTLFDYVLGNSDTAKIWFGKYSKFAKVKQDNIDSEVDPDKEQLISTNNDKTWERTGTERSSLTMAEKVVKSFIQLSISKIKREADGSPVFFVLDLDEEPQGIPQYYVTYQIVYGEEKKVVYPLELDDLGRAKSLDLYDVWNRLQRLLDGKYTYQEMLDALTYENGIDNNIVEAGTLGNFLRRLPNNADTLVFKEQFRKAFLRFKLPVLTVIKTSRNDGSVTFMVQREGASITRIAEEQIYSNLASNLGSTYISNDGQINLKKIIEDVFTGTKFASTSKLNSVFSQLGMDYSEKIKNTKEYVEFRNNFFLSLRKIYQANEELAFEFINQINNHKDQSIQLKGYWLNFVDKKHELEPFVLSQMVQNAENEMQSEFSIPNSLFLDIKQINEDPTKHPRYKTVLFRHSYFLDKFENKQRPIIELLNFNGYKVASGGTTEGISSLNLEDPEYLAMSMATLIKNGLLENIRAQVATTSLAVNWKWNHNQTGPNLPFSLGTYKAALKEITPASEITYAYSLYLVGDLRNDNPSLTIMSEVFEGMNFKERTKGMDAQQITDFVFNEENQTAIAQRLTDYFAEQKSQVKEKFQVTGAEELITKDSALKDTELNYTIFAITSHLYKVEEVLLFHGDLSQIGNFYKRANSPQSTGINLDDDQNVLDQINKELEDGFGSLVGEPFRVGKQFGTAIIKDEVVEIEINRGDIEQSFIEYSIKMGRKPTQQEVDTLMKEYDAYEKSNISDGFATINPDALKAFLILSGSWKNSTFEKVYQANLLWEKSARGTNLSALTKEQQIELNNFLEKAYSGDVVIPMLKFSYRGNGYVNGEVKEVFDKFALVPSFPILFERNSHGEVLHNEMIKNGLAYIKMESGTKLKGIAATDFFDQFQRGEIVFNGYELDTRYLKEQIATSDKMKENNRLGVQFRELLIGNTTNPNDLSKWEELVSNYVREIKNEILKTLGIKETEFGYDFSKVNKKRVANLLIKNADSRDLPDNIIQFLKGVTQGSEEMYKFLESSMGSNILENFIASIIRKMVHVKVPGSMMIQIAPSILGRDLRFYEKGTAAETKITLPKSMFGLLHTKEVDQALKAKGIAEPKRHQRFEELNRQLKNPNFRNKYKDSLRIVTYRIPTQGYNSMEVFDIVEFLPPWYGPHIVLPPGITTKSGTDYDYDKMSVILPVINNNGFVIKGTVNNKGNFVAKLTTKDLKKLEAYRKLSKESQADYRKQFPVWYGRIKKARIKNVILNDMISHASDILLDPVNYFRLIKPNSPNLIMHELQPMNESPSLNLLEKLGESGSQPKMGEVLGFSTWFKKWQVAKIKNLLGIAAVQNRVYSIFSNYGLVLNDTLTLPYNRLSDKDKAGLSVPVRNPLGESTDIQTPFVKNVLKWEILSQLINVTVDASSDDRFGYTAFNSKNFGAAVYMILFKNVDLPTVLKFFHQPIIMAYNELYNKFKSKGFDHRESLAKAAGQITGYNYYAGAYYVKNGEKVLSKSALMFNVMNAMDNFEKDLRPETLSGMLGFASHGKIHYSILAHYLKNLEESEAIRTAQSVINFDNQADSTMTAIFDRERAYQKTLEYGLVPEEFIQGIMNQSLRSEFYIAPVTESLYGSLYEILFSPENLVEFRFLIDSVDFSKRERAARTVTNDFLLMVVQNFGEYKGKSLMDISEQYIKNGFMYGNPKKLLNLRNKVKEVLGEENVTLRVLDSMVLSRRLPFENIRLFLGFEGESADKNRLSEELRLLLNHPNKEANLLAEHLIITGLIQSGWSKSPLYFGDLFPEEFITPIIGEAMIKFNKLSKEEKKYYRNMFGVNFLENFDNSQAYRGKNYLNEKLPNFPVAVEPSIDTPIVNTVKGIEINSYQTGLGNSLTNVHYAKNGKSDFDIISSDKSLKLTQVAKSKWGSSVEAWYKSNNAQSKGIPEGVEGDKYDMNLMIGLITDKLTQYPNLVEQINQNGGLAFLQKSTHTMGSGRWSSKNPKNMFMNSLIQAYKNVSQNQPVNIQQGNQTSIVISKDNISLNNAIQNANEKAFVEILPTLKYFYIDLPDGLTDLEVEKITTPIFDKPNSKEGKLYTEKYQKQIKTKADLDKAKKVLTKYVVPPFDEYGDSSIEGILEEVVERATRLGTDDDYRSGLGFKKLLDEYINERIPSEYIEQAKQILIKYNLYQFTQSNDPNQLNLFDQTIYEKLPTKTESGNVVLKSVYQEEGKQYANSIGGEFSMRVDNSKKHFGNPFSSVPAEIKKGLIPTKSTRESVEKYIDWVINSKDSRAEWIREILKGGTLKGKPIVYYKELNEPSHANALDYLINKYNWNNEDQNLNCTSI